jgi:hypothetical protein
VTIEYWGHCAFKITSPRGLTLLFDPWRNDSSGYWGVWFPKEFSMPVVDIGLSTHTHFDHDAIDRIQATMILDRMVGTYEFGDVKITGIADKHACVVREHQQHRSRLFASRRLLRPSHVALLTWSRRRKRPAAWVRHYRSPR